MQHFMIAGEDGCEFQDCPYAHSVQVIIKDCNTQSSENALDRAALEDGKRLWEGCHLHVHAVGPVHVDKIVALQQLVREPAGSMTEGLGAVF